MKQSILIVITLSTLLLGGCKIRIEVPEGGRVTTNSGSYDCETGAVCEIDVVDLFFDETFRGEPATGYRFDSWLKRQRGLCGGSDGSCRLFTSGFEGNDILMGFLERQEEVFFLVPQFVQIPTDAFDPALIQSTAFLVREEGLSVTYRFSENGSYSKRAGSIVASGKYTFELNDRVINYTQLADTDRNDLTGYAVFESFDAANGMYRVCYTDDQDVRSASTAVDICANGGRGNLSEPTRLRFFIQE